MCRFIRKNYVTSNSEFVPKIYSFKTRVAVLTNRTRERRFSMTSCEMSVAIIAQNEHTRLSTLFSRVNTRYSYCTRARVNIVFQSVLEFFEVDKKGDDRALQVTRSSNVVRGRKATTRIEFRNPRAARAPDVATSPEPFIEIPTTTRTKRSILAGSKPRRRTGRPSVRGADSADGSNGVARGGVTKVSGRPKST